MWNAEWSAEQASWNNELGLDSVPVIHTMEQHNILSHLFYMVSTVLQSPAVHLHA